ncbi:MAG TPA: hypothetical protein VJ725_28110 [Thermoanaerobaculia bacterium]|nr:hypothetical protein [Thermoanaerobaculia bacterium]
MEPPHTPAPPPPSPFQPITPGPAPVPGKTGGCGKPVVIGCLVVLVLVGIGLVGIFVYVSKHYDQIMNMSLRQTEAQIFAQMPEDVTPQERERLRAAFEGARQAYATRELQDVAQQGQQVQFKLLELVRKGNNMTRQDILDLTEMLERLAGTEGRGGDAEGAGEEV